MPKGVPTNGFRLTKNRIRELKAKGIDVDALKRSTQYQPTGKKPGRPKIEADPLTRFPKLVINNSVTPPALPNNESDEQIAARLAKRFDTIGKMVQVAAKGGLRALIIAGPGGLGKTYTVQQALKEIDPEGENHLFVKGYLTAPGLYKLFYENRLPGQVLILDDADSVFKDENSMNFLKAACDTTEERILTYFTKNTMLGEMADFPTSFEYEGTIVVLSNTDFFAASKKSNAMAPHFEALLTRSHYIDCGMTTDREYVIRLEQMIRESKMLRKQKLTDQQAEDVLEFIKQHYDRLNDLSLRIAVKIAGLVRSHPNDWREMAKITCMGKA